MTHYAPNWATWYWVTWIAVGFLPVELWALFSRKPEYTLSDQVWNLEGGNGTFAQWFIGSFTLWLFLHMTFRLFRR